MMCSFTLDPSYILQYCATDMRMVKLMISNATMERIRKTTPGSAFAPGAAGAFPFFPFCSSGTAASACASAADVCPGAVKRIVGLPEAGAAGAPSLIVGLPEAGAAGEFSLIVGAEGDGAAGEFSLIVGAEGDGAAEGVSFMVGAEGDTAPACPGVPSLMVGAEGVAAGVPAGVSLMVFVACPGKATFGFAVGIGAVFVSVFFAPMDAGVSLIVLAAWGTEPGAAGAGTPGIVEGRSLIVCFTPGIGAWGWGAAEGRAGRLILTVASSTGAAEEGAGIGFATESEGFMIFCGSPGTGAAAGVDGAAAGTGAAGAGAGAGACVESLIVGFAADGIPVNLIDCLPRLWIAGAVAVGAGAEAAGSAPAGAAAGLWIGFMEMVEILAGFEASPGAGAGATAGIGAAGATGFFGFKRMVVVSSPELTVALPGVTAGIGAPGTTTFFGFKRMVVVSSPERTVASPGVRLF